MKDRSRCLEATSTSTCSINSCCDQSLWNWVGCAQECSTCRVDPELHQQCHCSLVQSLTEYEILLLWPYAVQNHLKTNASIMLPLVCMIYKNNIVCINQLLFTSIDLFIVQPSKWTMSEWSGLEEVWCSQSRKVPNCIERCKLALCTFKLANHTVIVSEEVFHIYIMYINNFMTYVLM